MAAAVILPFGFSHPFLRDSKQLLPARRLEVFHALLDNGALIGIGMQGPEAIDRYNILQATLLAMQEAIESLPVPPIQIRIDGTHAPRHFKGVETHIGGDRRFPEIAAASIVAKVIRDRLMEQLHTDYPVYDWRHNKGYPTPAHRQAVIAHGPSPLHRQTFIRHAGT